jgi:hypothetical protein
VAGDSIKVDSLSPQWGAEFGKKDPMDGKRCISCGKLVSKKHWRLPKNDFNGCKLRPLCCECG